MKFYTQSTVRKVREQRSAGLSINKISEKYSVSSSTVSRWVKDLPGSDVNFNKARAHATAETERFATLPASFSLTENSAKLFVSLLYWCEGSKYPASNCLTFTNSDWKLSRTYLTLLRAAFRLDESKLRVHLQVHSTHPYPELLHFWAQLLEVSESQFYKPTVTNPTKRAKRLEYKGTCTIKYFDTKVLHNIAGIYQQFAHTHGRVA